MTFKIFMKKKLFSFWLLFSISFLSAMSSEFEIKEVIDATETPFSSESKIGREIFRNQILRIDETKQRRNTFNYFLGCFYFIQSKPETKKSFEATHQEIWKFFGFQTLDYLKKRKLDEIFGEKGLFTIALEPNFYNQKIENKNQETADQEKMAVQYWKKAEEEGCPLSRHMLAKYQRIVEKDPIKAANLYLKNRDFYLSIYELACMRNAQAKAGAKEYDLNETAKNLFKKNYSSNNCILSHLKFIEINLEKEPELLKEIMESVALVTKKNLCTTKEQKKVLATLQAKIGYSLFLAQNYELSRDFYKEAIKKQNLDENSLPRVYINLSSALWKIYEKTYTRKILKEKKKDLEEILDLLGQISLEKLSEQEAKKTAVETLLFLQNKIHPLLQEIKKSEKAPLEGLWILQEVL